VGIAPRADQAAPDRGIGLDADRAEVAFHPHGVMKERLRGPYGRGVHSTASDEAMAGDALPAGNGITTPGPVR
jgi:hypothetical protein